MTTLTGSVIYISFLRRGENINSEKYRIQLDTIHKKLRVTCLHWPTKFKLYCFMTTLVHAFSEQMSSNYTVYSLIFFFTLHTLEAFQQSIITFPSIWIIFSQGKCSPIKQSLKMRLRSSFDSECWTSI